MCRRILVLEFKIRWSLGRKRTLGTLNFHRLVPRPASSMPSSPSEMVQVEMAEAPPLVGAAGASTTPCVDDGRAKEAEPRFEDASGPVALILGSPRGPGYSPSREAALDDVMSVLGSSDIVDLGVGVLGLPGYPQVSLGPAS
jgi:hypothetical protein